MDKTDKVGKFEKLGARIGKLVERKQNFYGNSFGKSGDIMRILYPTGIALDQMDDALAVVRVIDKLFRIATDRDALGESPFFDIAGYGLLGADAVYERAAADTSIREDFLREMDPFAMWLKEACDLEGGNREPESLLIENYQKWNEMSGIASLGKFKFRKRLDELGPKIKRVFVRLLSGEMDVCYEGIGLKQ
jgi:hypothetical protein